MENECDDVLIEVFNYLDADSLKEASLVCKNWNRIIGNSAKIMKRFDLQLWKNNSNSCFWTDKLDEILSLERNFQSIDVPLSKQNYLNAAESFIEVSKRHGSQIRTVTFSYASNMKRYEFLEILRYMPRLEELRICDSSFIEFTTDDDLELKHLKTLKVRQSDWNIFHCLPNAKLNHLKVENMNELGGSSWSILSYLKNCQQLETLTVCCQSSDAFFQTNTKFPFSLRTFEWTEDTFDAGPRSAMESQILIDFLHSQASSLEILILNFQVSQNIVETVFTKLLGLKKFRGGFEDLQRDEEFYRNLKPHENLKKISSTYGFSDEAVAKGFLGNCPKLEKFFLDYRGRFIYEKLKFMSMNNRNLNFISIESIDTKSDSDAKFNSLKHVQFFQVRNFKSTMNFLDNNSTIETVDIKTFNPDLFTDDKLDSILKHPSILKLRVFSDLSTVSTVCEIMQGELFKRKNIKLSFVTKYECKELSGDPFLLFQFPQKKCYKSLKV